MSQGLTTTVAAGELPPELGSRPPYCTERRRDVGIVICEHITAILTTQLPSYFVHFASKISPLVGHLTWTTTNEKEVMWLNRNSQVIWREQRMQKKWCGWTGRRWIEVNDNEWKRSDVVELKPMHGWGHWILGEEWMHMQSIDEWRFPWKWSYGSWW